MLLLILNLEVEATVVSVGGGAVGGAVGGGGGGGGGWVYDSLPLYDITFIIRWNGKVIKRSYRNILFDTVIGIVVKFRSVSIYASFKRLKVIQTLFGTKLHSSKPTDINISVQEKQPTFSVKRKLK